MKNSFSGKFLERLLLHEEHAVRRWVYIYSDSVYAFVFYRVGRKAHLAEEIVQDTFIEALGKFKNYNPQRGSMLAWLVCLSRNNIRRAVRNDSRLSYADERLEISPCLLRASGSIATEPLPQEVLESRETVDLVRVTLASLPRRYGRVLAEHYCNRKPVKEVAIAMETSEAAAWSLLHRAKQAFKIAFLRLAGSASYVDASKEFSNE